MSDFNNKVFICTTNEEISSLLSGTIFSFKQYDRLIRASFKGEKVVHGELVGLINKNGVLEFSLNYQMNNQQVFGGFGTIKPSYTTRTSFHGSCSVTNGYKGAAFSFLLEEVSFQTHMAVRRKKTC